MKGLVVRDAPRFVGKAMLIGGLILVASEAAASSWAGAQPMPPPDAAGQLPAPAPVEDRVISRIRAAIEAAQYSQLAAVCSVLASRLSMGQMTAADYLAAGCDADLARRALTTGPGVVGGCPPAGERPTTPGSE